MKDLHSLAKLDAVAQAELVAKREVSPRELLEGCAQRLEAMNPLIRAVVTLDLERNAPTSTGPFGGVPFLIKDATPYPGMRWSMGSRALAKNVAPVGTPFTTRIDESGLVTIGKTATSEFGLLGSTETLLEGVTHNPWDLSLSAAGSSGGAAAAVAAGIVPMAHGNDGGGSLRIPAAVCGLFGFKPSRGRTVSAMLAQSDYGDLTNDHVISRSVRDSALFLSITEGDELPKVGYVQRPIERKLRIAAWSTTLMGEEPTPVVRRAYEDALALVASLGHEVELITAPTVDGPALRDAFFLIAGAAISGVDEMLVKMMGGHDGFEPFTQALVDEYRRQGADALERARTAATKCARKYLTATEPYDVILTPTLATPPFRLGHLSPILSRTEALRRTAESVGYTPIHNMAGAPAMSVPLFWSDEGLPIGTHFAAAPGAEATLLGLAYQLEAARPWRDRYAPYSYPRLFGAR